MKQDDNFPHYFTIRSPSSTYSTPKPSEKQLKQGQARSRIEQIQEQRELDKLLAELQ